MEYGKTLNLPQTDYPMRANLPQREPEILRFWEEQDIYRAVQRMHDGQPKFILHDGPPYANGDIHLGTTLNKVLKDTIVKFYSMIGYDAPYVPGWDTHGLPIEQQAIKALGLDREKIGVVEFRRHCRDYALKYVDVQRNQFRRLGVRGDWDNPYLTLDPGFEAVQIGVFGEMARKGYIYKGLKPVYWCADCETALAEAEVEYADKRSPSIYVKFPVKDARGLFEKDKVSVVIWTTTPWTIPANVAISVHPRFRYVLVDTGEQRLLLAAELSRQALEVMGIKDYQIVQSYEGVQLEGVICQHPILERDSLVILGEHVTLEQGTGCVHTAPGHGLEDYEVGRRYNLPVISPLDNKGRFTSEGGPFAGLSYDEANKAVTQELDRLGSLLHLDFVKHQYPHCWRCKSPVIFRATEQWFASIDGFRREALEAIEQVQWIPAWGKERIHGMVAERSDWCISRQRTWGVPIPIFYCADCNKEIINDTTITHLQELFRKHGSDVWFAREAGELVPEGLACPECGHRKFTKETDIMDVWFDSGSSHAAVLEQHRDLSWPADLYLEGSDQHRGWFNSSLSTSVATRGTAPYRAVLTHGYVVDEKGRKMSKSMGNGIDPLEVCQQMGADILRLWVASADYRRDVAVSPNILRQMTESYRKIRNTFRFLLGNIYDFNPDQDRVTDNQLQEIDRWAMLKLHRLIQRVTEAYRQYEFHTVYHAIHKFCVVDMSAFYLDIIKDRVYVSEAGDSGRRAAQTVMFDVLDALLRLLTPILAFTTEETWRYLPKGKEAPVSVQMAGWPVLNEEYLSTRLEERWERLISIRDEAAKALEIARQEKLIGQSLEAEVSFYPGDEDLHRFLKYVEHHLSAVLIISNTVLRSPGDAVPPGSYEAADIPGLRIKINRAAGEKCQRCWNYSESVGQDYDHPAICGRCAQVLKEISI
ncbi:MAG: isoleucine--tRNA ligase [Bacillota bacterium]